MYTLNSVEHHSVLVENQKTFSDTASARLADDGPKGVHSQMMRDPESNFVVETPKCLNSWDVQSKHIQPEDGTAESLYSGECRGGGGESYVLQGFDVYNQATTGDVTKTLTSARADSEHVPCVCYGFDRAAYNQGQNAQYNFSVEPMCVGNGQVAQTRLQGTVGTLNCMHDQQAVIVPKDVPAIAIDRAAYNQGQNAKYDFSVEEELAQPLVARGPGGGNADTVNALCARDWKGVGNQYVSDGKCIIQYLPQDSPPSHEG